MIPDGIGMLYTNFQPPTPCAAGVDTISFDLGHFAGKSLYKIGEKTQFWRKSRFQHIQLQFNNKKTQW
jgi:hypothetical protein